MPKPLTDLALPKKGDWRWKFLECLAKTASVTEACLAVRKSRFTVYRHRERYPKFRAKWDEALEISVELLEAHVRGRAFNEKDPASHLLAMFLLKAARPAKYRDNYQAPVDGPARTLAEIADEAEAARAAHIPESRPEGLH